MAAEFRQRSLGELFGMVWRHKLAIILPTLAVTLAVWYVVGKLPSIYESTTLLTIRPPAISNDVVRPLSSEDASQRLTQMTEEIKSRNSLEPMITKYNLFQSERAAGVPMELLIDRMRNNVKVEMVEKSADDKVPAFRISYRDREAASARNVTAELATKYSNAQTESLINGSKSTLEFIEKQLAESQTRLDIISKQKLEYMLSNQDKLPSTATALIAQLQGLHEREKTLADRQNSIEAEIGRMRDNRAQIERTKNTVRDVYEKEATERERISSDPKRTPYYADLGKRKIELEAQYQNMITTLKEKNPDVVAKKNEIESVKREMAKLEESAKIDVEESRQATRGRQQLLIQGYESDQQRIAGEITRQEQSVEQLKAESAQTRTQIEDLQRRIDSIPNAEVALDSYSRDYATAKTTYDEMLKKYNDVKLQSDRNNNNQGEQIRVVDAANTPQSPVAPKRAVLIGGGAVLGLLVGFLLAALFEVPRLLTIQNLDDAKHYTGLPVLASVPQLMTQPEIRWRKVFGLLKAAAAIAIAVVSVPVLIFALQFSHVFDRFVS